MIWLRVETISVFNVSAPSTRRRHQIFSFPCPPPPPKPPRASGTTYTPLQELSTLVMGNETSSVGSSTLDMAKRAESSAMRSSAGSETHWLMFWHFDGHIVRVYHDPFGCIILLDGQENAFTKSTSYTDVAKASAGVLVDKEAEGGPPSDHPHNTQNFTMELNGKTVNVEIINESSNLVIGGVQVYNSMSKYTYNLFYNGVRVPHMNERGSTSPMQINASIVSAEYIDGETPNKYKKGMFTIETKLYHRHELVASKTTVHRFNNFLDLASDVYAYFRSRPSLYDAIPSLPWRIPKWMVQQGPEELEKRRSSLHSWIQKVSSLPGAVMLPTLTAFLGFSEAEIRPFVEYKLPVQEENSVILGTQPLLPNAVNPMEVANGYSSSEVSVPPLEEASAECV